MDAGRQHGRGRAPRRHLRGGPERRAGELLVVAEPLVEAALGRGLDGRWTASPAREMERWTLPAAVRAGRRGPTGAAGTSSSWPTTSPPRTAPGWCTRRPPSAPTTCVVPRVRPAGGQPGAARRPLRARRRAGRRRVLQDTPTQTLVARPRARAGCCSGTSAYEHAYPHCWRCHTAAALLRAAVLVHPHHRRSRTRCSRENERHQLVPRDHQVGPLRRLAAQQHRLGAVPEPLLGHAAADLALRRRRATWTCVGSLAELGELAGTDLSDLDPHRPFVDDVTFSPARRCRGEPSRRVPEVIDAWYDSGSMPFAQWGYPHAPGRRRCSSARTPPSSSARRSTRPAAGSTR